MIVTTPLAAKPSIIRRAFRFFTRTTSSVLLVSAILMTMQHQKTVILDQRTLDHPLLVALAGIDASIEQTEILAWTGIDMSSEPAFSTLKNMAASIASGFSAQSVEEFWSESDGSYRVVYYAGGEEAGGRWLASARRVDNAFGVSGETEIALHRVIYGPVHDLSGAMEWSKSRLRRSVDGPTGAMSHRIKISARPSSQESPEYTARSILSAVGADVRLLIESNGALTLAGYTSKLPGATDYRGQTVNVVVRISHDDRGGWIELGHPTL